MRHVIGVVVAVVCAVAVTSAQQGTADLRGRVVDDQQAAMPGVAVVVRNQASGIFRETTSGPDGSFYLAAMAPGMYKIEAALEGFTKYQRGDLRLEVGRTTEIDLPMALGGLSESLTVRAEAPLLDTTSKEVGGNVSAEEFVNTPSFNRNFAGFLSMVPGVVTTSSTSTFGGDTISVGGQGARNVVYTLDGSDNNDGLTGGGTSSQARIPIEAVQEFKLLTSQFNAEYGGTTGAIVNAVSKQGTNRLHGSGFGFFQDQHLSTRDYFVIAKGLTEPPTTQQQYGGTLGGPIVKDKAHFFFSVERIILDTGITRNIASRPDISGTDFQITRNWNTFIRFDHQLNAKNSWGVRWLRESSPQPLQLNPAWTRVRAGAETDVDQTVVGTLSSVFGSTAVNTLRGSFTSEVLHFANPVFLGNGYEQKSLLPTLVYLSFEDQQSPTASIRHLYGWGLDDVFSRFVPNKAGDHELKFGLNYNYVPLRLEDYGNQNGTFTFNTDRPFNASDPRTYPERLSIRVPGVSDFRMSGHYVNGFAQDTWKINNLSLSLGARYELELVRTPNQDNPLFASDPNGYPVDKNNISPRLGFTYAPGSGGHSVVRGGMGLFYQRTVLTPLTPMFTSGRYSSSFIAQFPTNNFDPGPRNGLYPTDPRLAGGPLVNHAALDALFPAGVLTRNVGTVRFDNPDREVPWARQYSAGFEQQIGNTLALTVDYLRSEQRRVLMLADLNPARRATALATGAITRTNPLVGAVNEFATRVDEVVNEGWVDFDSLTFSGTKRLSHGYTARISYAYSKARGNTTAGVENPINSQYLGDLRLDSEVGPSAVDRPHILSVSGSWDVARTGGLRLGGLFQARSGTPFSLVNSTFDADQNGITLNEYLAAGTYSGTGADAFTVDYAGGRNGARGPNYVSLDLRVGYHFRLAGGRTLDMLLDVFNTTNRVNFAEPAGDQRTPATFLRLTSTTGATRTAQINVRLGF
jgi:hypothetical protein